MFDGLPQNDVLNTLLKARNIVEKGWCQTRLHDYDKHCVIGAVIMAITGKNVDIDGIPRKDKKLFQEVLTSFASELRDGKWYFARYNRYGYSTFTSGLPMQSLISSWNDTKSRRKGQVLKQFDKVISQQFK